ncbi:MAG: YfhO family protein, partial [Lachnospiraceae bacterium]|nr:YfhO family protein [Lachnospiraceae bacterium]
KYALAGLTSYVWISRFVRNKKCAVAASVMYAFSGFMNENLLFYHFHDVVLLFPLLLITFDMLMEERKHGPFIAAVFINAIVNYFFFFGEVYFLIAYFILRYVMDEGVSAWKRLPEILFEGITGVAAGMVILLPSMYFTLQNPRVKMDYYGNNSLVFTGERYLYILKALIFPGEVMSDQSAVLEHNFASCAAYIPMAGLILVIAFLLMYRKNWITRMLKWCLVMAVIPILNAAFSLFAGLYHRWYYMPVLLFALCGAIVLDRIETDARFYEPPTPTEDAVTRGTVIWGIITAAFIAFLLFVPWSSSEESKIYHPDVFAAWCCVAVGGTILTWVILYFARKRRFQFFLIATCVFAVGTSAFLLHLYHDANGELADVLYDRITTSAQFPDPSPSYRYANNDNPETLTHSYPSTANFCSTVSGSIFRLYTSLGLSRDVKSPDPPVGFYHLISARYKYSPDKNESLGELTGTYEGKSKTYYLYERECIPPIGFTYDTYMTASDFAKTQEDTRAIVMLKTLVIPDEKEEEVKKVLRPYSEEADGAAVEKDLEKISSAHLKECSYNVQRTTSSYASTINAGMDSYAFYSIPNDSGWSATVNGEEAEILDINGFMAVRIGAGENRIELRYEVPGLKAGIILSVLAVITAILYSIIAAYWRRRA